MKQKLELFNVQKQHVETLVRSVGYHKTALDSSETGCGKTLCAVETAKALGLTPLVVCPKATVSAWQSCLKGQNCLSYGVINWEKLRMGKTEFVSQTQRAKKPPANESLITKKKKPKVAFKWNLDPASTLIIFDEVHKAKGRSTQNSSLVTSAVTQGFRTLALSATAAEHPGEMRALGYMLGLHKLTNFWHWAQDNGCSFDTYGGIQFPEANHHKLVALRKLIYEGPTPRGSRLTRHDLGVNFSKCCIVKDPIDFDSKDLISLTSELHEELTTLETRRKADEDPIAVTKILRLRQKIEMLKVPTLVELIHNSRENGMAVAVFLNFSDSINAVAKRLNEPYVQIVGGQSDKVREAAMADFQEDRCHIALINTAAGGVGVNLHDTQGKFPRISYISPTYNAKDYHQTLGRIDRLGAKSDTLQVILVAAGTIEDRILEVMEEKIKNLNLLHEKPVIEEPSPTTEMITLGEIAHAEYGPSKLKMYKACPGYKATEGTNEAAESGTRIHLAMETEDSDGLTDFETSLVQYMQSAEVGIFNMHNFETGAFEDHKEIRFHIDLLAGLNTFGTMDRLCISGDTAIAIDYKTGEYAIDEPHANQQAQAYTVGAFQRFPQINVVHFYFICAKRDEILYDTFHRHDMPAILEELSAIILRAQQVDKNFDKATTELLNPTSLVCDYCARAGTCPAITNRLLEVAKKYGIDKSLAVPKIVHGEDVWEPENLAALLNLAPILEKAVAGWRQQAKVVMLELGVDIPGFKVADRAGKRSINSVKAAYGLLREKGFLSLEDFLDKLTNYPIGAFEELAKELAPPREKKKFVAELISSLESDGFITHGEDIRYITRQK